MNQENIDYLIRQIRGTGFGDGHAENLKSKIDTGEKDFTLTHQQGYGKDEVAAALQFHRPDNTDRYYFNHYSLTLKQENADPVKQVFYLNAKQDNITLKQAYNMLSGRSVKKEISPKEGEKYQAWLQLDLKAMDVNGQYKVRQFHPNYGFDLEATLHKYPIRELMTNDGIQRLLDSLERGNRQQVTIGQSGNESKMFIEAAPQFKTLNLYDVNQKLVIIPANKIAQPDTWPKMFQPSSTEKPDIKQQMQAESKPEIKPAEKKDIKQETKQKTAKEEKAEPAKRTRQKLH